MGWGVVGRRSVEFTSTDDRAVSVLSHHDQCRGGCSPGGHHGRSALDVAAALVDISPRVTPPAGAGTTCLDVCTSEQGVSDDERLAMDDPITGESVLNCLRTLIDR